MSQAGKRPCVQRTRKQTTAANVSSERAALDGRHKNGQRRHHPTQGRIRVSADGRRTGAARALTPPKMGDPLCVASGQPRPTGRRRGFQGRAASLVRWCDGGESISWYPADPRRYCQQCNCMQTKTNPQMKFGYSHAQEKPFLAKQLPNDRHQERSPPAAFAATTGRHQERPLGDTVMPDDNVRHLPAAFRQRHRVQEKSPVITACVRQAGHAARRVAASRHFVSRRPTARRAATQVPPPHSAGWTPPPSPPPKPPPTRCCSRRGAKTCRQTRASGFGASI